MVADVVEAKDRAIFLFVGVDDWMGLLQNVVLFLVNGVWVVEVVDDFQGAQGSLDLHLIRFRLIHNVRVVDYDINQLQMQVLMHQYDRHAL